MAENKKNKGGITAASVTALAEPIAKELGLSIWDVRYVKEGASWYLRIFIDKEGGVDLNDCERMSRAVDKPLDELDPIDQSYFLEISSPGIERELTRPEHFEKMAGREVCVSFFRPIDGMKEIIGTLVGLRDGSIVLTDLDGTEFEISKKDASKVHLTDDEPELDELDIPEEDYEDFGDGEYEDDIADEDGND